MSQTVLSAGDIAVIGFKTNTSTDAGNDAIKLVTLVDLQCNTQFIVTDNNWNNSVSNWSCNDDEFAVEITCNTIISAGSVFYLDVDASGNTINCSGGSISSTNLGSPWGINYGLSSQGDNIYILQGTRAAPTFIFALKHIGAFSNTSCSNKDQAGLPSSLTLGTNAIVMSSTKNQWHYNCVTNSGTAASLRTAICNSANWVNSSGQSWDNTSGFFTVTTGNIQYGVLAVSGSGCGCLANCNLAYSGSTNCGSSGVSGDCSAGYQNMSKNITVPAGCTYQVTAEMKPRNYGCSSSGADGNCQSCDVVKVDISSGSKSFQQGASNSALSDSYTLTGPGTIVVSGKANRADEIITYAVKVTPCACLLTILPIELVEFNVKIIDESVELTWTTMSENGNNFFSVERTSDLITWETIFVIGGHGSSASVYHYSIFDSSPIKGIAYYRLKQTDKNELYTYSKIISVDNLIKEKKIIKRINILGEDVDENTTGLVILVFDNGEIKKIYQ